MILTNEERQFLVYVLDEVKLAGINKHVQVVNMVQRLQRDADTPPPLPKPDVDT